jgi:hypothetical protein
VRIKRSISESFGILALPAITLALVAYFAGYSVWGNLGRPWVDTLKGSDHANMKELRFDAADGVWRVAFAFDPNRQAILLVAGDKSGGSQAKFYKWLLNTGLHRVWLTPT